MTAYLSLKHDGADMDGEEAAENLVVGREGLLVRRVPCLHDGKDTGGALVRLQLVHDRDAQHLVRWDSRDRVRRAVEARVVICTSHVAERVLAGCVPKDSLV